jgi:hypothetical protein
MMFGRKPREHDRLYSNLDFTVRCPLCGRRVRSQGAEMAECVKCEIGFKMVLHKIQINRIPGEKPDHDIHSIMFLEAIK